MPPHSGHSPPHCLRHPQVQVSFSKRVYVCWQTTPAPSLFCPSTFQYLVCCRSDTIECLLSSKADVKAVDSQAWPPTPFTQIRFQRSNLSLLCLGCEVLPQGDTVLHCVVSGKTPWPSPAHLQTVIKLFVAEGVSVNAQNKIGRTPLHLASSPDVSRSFTLNLIHQTGCAIFVGVQSRPHESRSKKEDTASHHSHRSSRD